MVYAFVSSRPTDLEPPYEDIDNYHRRRLFVRPQPMYGDPHSNQVEPYAGHGMSVAALAAADVEPDTEISTPVEEIANIPTADVVLDAPSSGLSLKMVLISMVAFMAFAMWTLTLHKFLVEKMHGGKDMDWMWSAIYSIALTTVLALIMWCTCD